MERKSILFWYRQDLRIFDNKALVKAYKINKLIYGVYIFDLNIFKKVNKNSNAQAWFLIESLKELKLEWKKRGSDLLILEGDSLILIPQLAKILNTEYIVWNKGIEPEQRELEKEMIKKIDEMKIKVFNSWDRLILQPGSIINQSGLPYKVYTPFMHKWRDKYQRNNQIRIDLSNQIGNFDNFHAYIKYISKENLFNSFKYRYKCKSLKDLSYGFKGKTLCPCKPGSIASNLRLMQFVDSSLNIKHKNKSIQYNITNYEKNRDVPSINGTSFLSAALNFGTISQRQVWESIELIKQSQISRHIEKYNSIKIWENELIWREFYQHCLFHFPQLAKGPYRKKWESFQWENNKSNFNRWKDGLTGFPIIDASIRQLNSTGWMHNRCRMIVASFLVKDLLCDWRLGEEFFMRQLVDGDVASNNGGWQWSASCGMDTKPLRIFNPVNQAIKFDKAASFIRKWIPELSHVNTPALLSANITTSERREYPEPIVNHKFQRETFRSKYKLLS